LKKRKEHCETYSDLFYKFVSPEQWAEAYLMDIAQTKYYIELKVID